MQRSPILNFFLLVHMVALKLCQIRLLKQFELITRSQLQSFSNVIHEQFTFLS